nr:hypothetical protein [Cellulosimicrobium sp. MM]
MTTSRKQVVERQADLLSKLESADTTELARAFRRCVGRLGSNYWLDNASAFLAQPSNELAPDRSQELSASPDDFLDYVATSALLHCTDAWSYLGRSLSALTAGLRSEALHLAYYAELRSALSILAANGVAVAAKCQYVASPGRKIQQVGKSATHTAAWQLLDKWSTTSRGIDEIGQIVRIAGQPLRNWLDEAGLSGTAGGIISSLLKTWGMDLAAYENDRMRRSLASYIPSNLHLSSTGGLAEWSRGLLVDVCDLLEPASGDAFPLLDAELLAQTFRLAGDDRNGGDSKVNLERVVQRVLGDHHGGTQGWARKLDLLSGDPTRLVHAAMDVVPVGFPADPIEIRGMLGRALILARLAIGSMARLQHAAGVTPEDMTPWADYLGVAHGLWNPPPRPPRLTDMWADVQADLEALEIHHPAGAGQIFALQDKSAGVIARLTELTRAPLWSLGA